MSETNALKGRDRATVRTCNLNPAMWRVPTIPVSNGHEVRGIFGMYPAKGGSCAGVSMASSSKIHIGAIGPLAAVW